MVAGEIMEGDAIVADKGFDIADELSKLNMKLNIPPFLEDKVGFGEDDVIKTKIIAHSTEYMWKEQFAKCEEIGSSIL